jgi:ubiquinone/menaquinone biosynthesis C-methylase UbiE
MADVDAALAQLHRVLRPDGRPVVVDTDWDGLASRFEARSHGPAP